MDKRAHTRHPTRALAQVQRFQRLAAQLSSGRRRTPAGTSPAPGAAAAAAGAALDTPTRSVRSYSRPPSVTDLLKDSHRRPSVPAHAAATVAATPSSRASSQRSDSAASVPESVRTRAGGGWRRARALRGMGGGVSERTHAYGQRLLVPAWEVLTRRSWLGALRTVLAPGASAPGRAADDGACGAFVAGKQCSRVRGRRCLRGSPWDQCSPCPWQSTLLTMLALGIGADGACRGDMSLTVPALGGSAAAGAECD